MSQDEIVLQLDKREITGKAVKQLRRDGLVPAVIHDHGKPSIVVSGQYIEVLKAFQKAGKRHPISLKADGKNFTALIKKVDLDPRKNSLTHVVFNAVRANEKVEAEIPIHAKYDEGNDASPAERAGLIVLHNLDAVEVQALPKDLPDHLEFNAEKLVEIGDHATVADLIVPAGVEIKAEPTQTIASVFEPSALAAANDAAGGTAEPEDAETVESEHESSAEEGTQKEEIRPGGKQEFEDKTQGHEPTKK